MKKKLFLTFTAVYALTYAALTAADPDLVKGVDFTRSSSFTQAMLNQLVDNGYVGPYRGMVIFTNGTPDVSAIPKYARYLWLDSSATPPTPKVWNTNGYWTNITALATLANGSVTAGKIATDAVYTTNIVDAQVTGAKIATGTITGVKIGTGEVTTTNIADGTIVSADIASATIASANLVPSIITSNYLAAQSVSTVHLATNFALQGTNIAAGTITSANIGQNAIAVTNLAANSITASYIATGTLPSKFVSGNTAIPAAGATATIAHGLTGIPHAVRLVLRCTTADAATGYADGDEIDYASVATYDLVVTRSPALLYYVDATNVKIVRTSYAGLFLMHKTTGVLTAPSATSNFSLKVYAVYIP